MGPGEERPDAAPDSGKPRALARHAARRRAAISEADHPARAAFLRAAAAEDPSDFVLIRPPEPEPSEEDEHAEGADEGWFEAAEASSPSWQMGDEAPQWGQRVLEAERSALEELAA